VSRHVRAALELVEQRRSLLESGTASVVDEIVRGPTPRVLGQRHHHGFRYD